MLRIMLISDMEKFLEKVLKCRGDVLLHLTNDTVCNLKTDSTAMEVLKLFKVNGNELCLTLTDPRDYAIMVEYMMHAA